MIALAVGAAFALGGLIGLGIGFAIATTAGAWAEAE